MKQLQFNLIHLDIFLNDEHKQFLMNTFLFSVV